MCKFEGGENEEECGIYNDGMMTITGGSISTNKVRDDNGGGIAHRGTGALDGVTLNGNTAPDLDGDDDGYGAGIYSRGVITVTDCTVAHNQAHNHGGVYNGTGSIYSAGALTLTPQPRLDQHGLRLRVCGFTPRPENRLLR